jgi:flagellar protein FliS
MFNQGARAYAQVNVETAVSTANPVQIVVLLYEGAISAIASARGEMERNNVPQKARLINKAIDIVEGLRNALEFNQGGEIAVSLNDLYLYMVQRLSIANLKNDPAVLAEVSRLLTELLAAWKVLASAPQDPNAATASTSPTFSKA